MWNPFRQQHKKLDEVEARLATAKEDLEQTRAQTPRITELARKLHDIPEDNGIAAALTAHFQGPR